MTDYYHGGVRGLGVGDHILPPEITGVASTADYGAAKVCRRDRVYLVTDHTFAGLYALIAPYGGRGWVYEVEPIGTVEPDTDWLGEPGGSVCAPSARVIRVVRRGVAIWNGLNAQQALASIEGT